MAPRSAPVRVKSGRLGCLVVALVAVSGCSGTVKEAAKSAAPAVVESSIEEAREPDNRRDIALLLKDPKIREASSELAEAVANGAINALTDVERLDKMQAASEAFVLQVGSALAKTMATELRPQIAATVADSMDQALDRTFAPENQQKAQAFARALTRAVVEGMTRELAAPATSPAAPSGASGTGDLEQTDASGIAAIARQAGRGAALGFQDAVHQTELRREQGLRREGDVLALPGQIADASAGLVTWAAFALGALALAAVGALIWFALRARRYQRESQEREQALLLLASVIKSAEAAPWGGDLRERIREAARDHSAADTLRGLLRRHSGLRLDRLVES